MDGKKTKTKSKTNTKTKSQNQKDQDRITLINRINNKDLKDASELERQLTLEARLPKKNQLVRYFTFLST